MQQRRAHEKQQLLVAANRHEQRRVSFHAQMR